MIDFAETSRFNAQAIFGGGWLGEVAGSRCWHSRCESHAIIVNELIESKLMSDLDPVLKARADLLEDICCKVAVAKLDGGEGIDLDGVVEQLQQKLRSAKEGV
jgi:hypothetical protein